MTKAELDLMYGAGEEDRDIPTPPMGRITLLALLALLAVSWAMVYGLYVLLRPVVIGIYHLWPRT